MKKIANIISEVELFNHKKIDWINYSQRITESNLELPTLFIGWNNYKKIYPFLYPNILSKRTTSQYPSWWEFSMDEKITDHFNGVEQFIKNAPREYCNLYKYKSIDPIKDQIESIEQIFTKIHHGISMKIAMHHAASYTYYQYKDEIIYVLDINNKEIFGVYLNSFKYFGFDIKNIQTYFSNRFESKFIDLDGTLYQSYYKQFPDFDQLKRTMVLFLV